MKSSKYTLVSLVIFVLSACTYAEVPDIQQISDQRATDNTYTYTPTLKAGEKVVWTKAYGPDSLTVNPVNGEVHWRIPDGMPSESLHIGLRATNSDGHTIETWILTIGEGRVIYIGPNEEINTLKTGMASMDSGDTLVMRNGTWLSKDGANTIPGNEAKTQKPPSGDASKYTTLMAEDPGQVILDAQNNNSLIQIFGSTKHPDWPLSNNGFTGSTDYLAIKGLVLINSRIEGLRVAYSKYVKLINIGVGSAAAVSASSYANVYIYRSSHILIEGLYAWGHGRYKVQFKDSSESVVRRSVVRVDDIRVDDPVGAFIAYCSKDIVFQNNIVVDADSSDFWHNYNEIIGAFGVPATNCESYPEGNIFSDSLVLNADLGAMSTDARENTKPTIWRNIVAWDISPARHNDGNSNYAPVLSGVGATLSDRLTVGKVETSPGYFLYSRSQNSEVSNSIFFDLHGQDPLIRNTEQQFLFTHNYVHEASPEFQRSYSDGSGTPTVVSLPDTLEVGEPVLRYITMLPDNSALRSAEKEFGPIGAELLYMRGQSGAHYGDPGYDQILRNVPMWPFPGEEQMHKHMSNYHYSGPSQSGNSTILRGDRGFAESGQTLTNYVWGYLGNITPPLRVRASGINRGAIIAWEQPPQISRSNVQSYKIYRTDTSVMQLLHEQSASKPTTYVVNDLTNGQSTKLGVTAVDHDNQESALIYEVSVTPREDITITQQTPSASKEDAEPTDQSGGGSMSMTELYTMLLLLIALFSIPRAQALMSIYKDK